MIPVMANYDGRDGDDDHGHRMVVMIMVSVLRSNNINIIYNSSSGRAKSYSMSYSGLGGPNWRRPSVDLLIKMVSTIDFKVLV